MLQQRIVTKENYVAKNLMYHNQQNKWYPQDVYFPFRSYTRF